MNREVPSCSVPTTLTKPLGITIYIFICINLHEETEESDGNQTDGKWSGNETSQYPFLYFLNYMNILLNF